ncbi:MAG: hypothetical protein ACI94C_000234, partial [Sediminicola sp.]
QKEKARQLKVNGLQFLKRNESSSSPLFQFLNSLGLEPLPLLAWLCAATSYFERWSY